MAPPVANPVAPSAVQRVSGGTPQTRGAFQGQPRWLRVTSAGLFLPTLGFPCASQLHVWDGVSKATSSWGVGF